MHHAGWTLELDRTQLVPGWESLVEQEFRRRELPIEKFELSNHPRGIRVGVVHECPKDIPCPWTKSVFEHAAFDAAEALRRAWGARSIAPAPADFVVFYSWQATSPAKANRYLIEEALKRAVSELRKDDTVTVEPVIDRDTAGVAGAPDITSTIFGKIEKAAMFVADVSLVLHDQATGRRSPNPNVLIELGYAAHALGWDRVLLVTNTHFGEVEQLPFDLRQKRVTRYEMGPDDKPANARNNLVTQLEVALRHCIALGHRTPGELTLVQKGRKFLAEVSKANNSSYAPVTVASTIRFPGVSREEYRQQLHAVLPRVGHMVSVDSTPDPSTKLTGLCKGVVCHLTGVDDEGLTLEIPPEGARVKVPLELVDHLWQHDHSMLGLKLAVTVVVPENVYHERVRLESE